MVVFSAYSFNKSPISSLLTSKFLKIGGDFAITPSDAQAHQYRNAYNQTSFHL